MRRAERMTIGEDIDGADGARIIVESVVEDLVEKKRSAAAGRGPQPRRDRRLQYLLDPDHSHRRGDRGPASGQSARTTGILPC